MATTFLGLGSNLGNKEENLAVAIEKIGACEGVRVVKKSSFYKSKPVGGPPQPDFANGVIEVETDIGPQALLRDFKKIELEIGRGPGGVKWGPRLIDIDILLYDDMITKDEDLIIPHRYMHERIFVLGPMCEISPETKHPILKKTVCELLSGLIL